MVVIILSYFLAAIVGGLVVHVWWRHQVLEVILEMLQIKK